MTRQKNVTLLKTVNKFWISLKTKRYIFIVLCLITSLGVVGFNYFTERSPITACHAWGFAPANAQVMHINPEKIVVKPWKGQHHVYGVFEVPGGYLNEKLFTVAVPGERIFCGVLSFQGTDSFEGVVAKPGNYLMKGLLNTRVALWLISQGKAKQLKQPQYWKLGYVKKNDNSKVRTSEYTLKDS